MISFVPGSPGLRPGLYSAATFGGSMNRLFHDEYIKRLNAKLNF
jgi:hypothetical protein